jgi:NAD(P)H-hydrate epimerase
MNSTPVVQINQDVLKRIYKKRRPEVRKYYYGSLLVIGGSKLYSGSPAFNALSAYRTGVDLVTVLAPHRAANIIASFSPNIIAYPLKTDYINKTNMEELLNFSNNKTAVVIGGGMGREKKTLIAVDDYLHAINLPCVIDADAIYAFADNKNGFLDKNFVLTPHSHEFFVLTGRKVGFDMPERVEAVRSAAAEIKKVILLKGPMDVISDGNRVAINASGSPLMTKGGMGDTLAGICGALLARGIDSFLSACAAAYINGKAGEIAGSVFGESVTATDLIDAIPKVLPKV